MKIIPCTPGDVTAILELYEAARQLQTERKMVVWPMFDSAFIAKEIAEQRQWKIINNATIACNWSITWEDKDIWEDRENGDALYIHRLVTNPKLRGKRYIDSVVHWAKAYAQLHGKKFVRLDTLGHNTKLIEHYTSAGFDFLGMQELTHTTNLPAHYQQEPNCCFFEMQI